ncbi:hypothetical protein HKX48_004796 [Thoreauomyces humboldtii]|nr:hypothetical protein HKX48_004796 [Thoreauomyces humboldtii]
MDDYPADQLSHRFPFHFTIDPCGVPSFRTKHAEIVWRVTATLKRKGDDEAAATTAMAGPRPSSARREDSKNLERAGIVVVKREMRLTVDAPTDGIDPGDLLPAYDEPPRLPSYTDHHHESSSSEDEDEDTLHHHHHHHHRNANNASEEDHLQAARLIAAKEAAGTQTLNLPIGTNNDAIGIVALHTIQRLVFLQPTSTSTSTATHSSTTTPTHFILTVDPTHLGPTLAISAIQWKLERRERTSVVPVRTNLRDTDPLAKTAERKTTLIRKTVFTPRRPVAGTSDDPVDLRIPVPVQEDRTWIDDHRSPNLRVEHGLVVKVTAVAREEQGRVDNDADADAAAAAVGDEMITGGGGGATVMTAKVTIPIRIYGADMPLRKGPHWKELESRDWRD